MDARGGCCIARYGGGGGGASVYNMSKVDRIMSRFRPIAPKPASAGSVSSGSSLETSEVCTPRSVRGRRRNSGRSSSGSSNSNGSSSNGGKKCNSYGSSEGKKRKAANDHQEVKVDDGRGMVVTLQLLPETPDRRYGFPERECVTPPKLAKNGTTWLSFGGNNTGDLVQTVLSGGHGASASGAMMIPRVAGSCVTVECVTDTWGDVDALGRTDEERRLNLEGDTCPGFISDGYGRVTWTNSAYRKMVLVGQQDEVLLGDGQLVVWLVMKERLPPPTMAGQKAFTCRVRVQYGLSGWNNTNNGKESSSTTVPCDVWRMDGGGFAWRLDVKAALCLGR